MTPAVVYQVIRREGCTGSCCSSLLAFHGEGSASPWRVIGDATFIKYFFIFFSVTALKRVLEEHRNVGDILTFIYVSGGG